MKKYARLRKECSEFENALYDATPDVSFSDQSRGSGGSGSPQPYETPARASHSLGLSFAGALKKLGSFREVAGSRRHTVAPCQPCPGVSNGSRSGSARWEAQEDTSQSGRWGSAETASLSGRWGSVSTSDHWDDATTQRLGANSFRDSSLSLSHSGRLVEEGEPWTASKPPIQLIQRQSSVRGAVPLEVVTISSANPSDKSFGAADQHNISMKETQGWLASVTRPLQPRKTRSAWDDPNEFNWRAATAATTRRESGPASRKPTAPTISQSMRYDRLKTIDLVENPSFDDDGHHHAVMMKASSMREGGAHSGAIMAMARAYSEKHGVPQAILECVACGRGLGVVVQGTPGNDTSFCQACRPHAVGEWTYHTKAPETGKGGKRKGMMQFCKKILRLGKKPNKAKG